MIVVRNASDAELILSYASDAARVSTSGEASVGPCMSTLVTFGGAQERLTIATNGQQVVDTRVPPGTSGYFVVPLFVLGDGRVIAGDALVVPDPPVEPQAPAGCGGDEAGSPSP